MKNRISAGAVSGLLLVSGQAVGQSIQPPITKVVPLLIFTDKSYSHEIVRLGDGGCIRGPFVVFAPDGKELFRLEKDIVYPAECEKGLGRP